MLGVQNMWGGGGGGGCTNEVGGAHPPPPQKIRQCSQFQFQGIFIQWQNKDRKSRRAWQSLALDYNFLYICKQLNFDLPWV